MATICELWRYPVKSMGGQRVQRLRLSGTGAEGDRLFAVQQTSDGRLLTGRLEPRLLGATALLADGVARIRLPGGDVTASDSGDVDAILSRWLGQNVTLVRARPGGPDATHLIPVSAEVADHMRANPASTGVFTRATVGRDPVLGHVLEWRSPGAGFSDGGAVHLLSTRQLRRLRASTGAMGWSVRRFRPNVVVDIPRAEADEDSWIERELRVGSATLRPNEPCIRCVLATRAQPGLREEPRILTALRPRRARLGIYASIEEEGEVKVGDRVAVLD